MNVLGTRKFNNFVQDHPIANCQSLDIGRALSHGVLLLKHRALLLCKHSFSLELSAKLEDNTRFMQLNVQGLIDFPDDQGNAKPDR